MLFGVLFSSEIMLECWGAAYTRVRLIHESLRYSGNQNIKSFSTHTCTCTLILASALLFPNQFILKRIHQMQIWRITRLAPRTSCMKARLVRLWCSVLTMLFRKVLLCCRFRPFVSPSLSIFVFMNATAREWNLPEQRKCSFFSFLVCLRGETNAFTGFSDRIFKVHSLGYCTVVFVSCDSVRVDANANNFFLWDRGYLSRRAFLWLGEVVGHESRIGTPPNTT